MKSMREVYSDSKSLINGRSVKSRPRMDVAKVLADALRDHPEARMVKGPFSAIGPLGGRYEGVELVVTDPETDYRVKVMINVYDERS